MCIAPPSHVHYAYLRFRGYMMNNDHDAMLPEVLEPDSIESLPTVRPQQNISIDMLLSQALQNNVPVESLERLVALRQQLKAEAAKEAFDAAMAAFQQECPPIGKSRPVKLNSNQVVYSYAPIEDLVQKTQVLRGKYGFSYAIQTETFEKRVKAICIVKHIAGHQEPFSVEVPLSAGTNLMSATQIVAAAITFASRYAFKNAFGLVTIDEDDETLLRKRDESQPATEGELSELLTLLDRVNVKPERIMKKYSINSMSELSSKSCQNLITWAMSKL